MSIKIGQTLDFQNTNGAVNLPAPSGANDAATKSYVDSLLRGLKWKEAVRAAATADTALDGSVDTFDGVTVVSGDRVLLLNQTDASENGIWVFNGSGSAMTRADDADSEDELVGSAVTIEEGTTYGDKVYVLATDAPIVVDTTDLTYTSVGGAGASYTGSNGVVVTGTNITADVGTGLAISGGKIVVDTNVVARKVAANVGNGSNTSITVNHNLGTRDVVVNVYANNGSYDNVWVEVQRPDANNVTLVFGTAPASNAYRVVISG